MAADNAIIIAMVAANFAPKNRKQIIMWGVFAAFIFRIIFAFSATFLFQFAFIKLIGGALLLWIVNELRQDLFNVKKIKSPTKKSKEPSFMSGVYKVLIADITLSFDNVLGVAGAAKEHYFLLFFGLFLSVVLIGAAASYFAKYIQDHKWVGYVGLVVILLVAIQLIIGGLIDYNVLTINEPFASWF
jgi:YjbE family integral membrane protein